MLGENPYEVKSLEVRSPKTPEGLRQKTVSAFLKEQKGLNKREVTRYQYVVERLRDKRRIYLQRPTRRGGFDFEVHVQGLPSSKDMCYTSREMIADLRNKSLENPKKFKLLFEAIERVYRCEEPEQMVDGYRGLDFQTGEKTETILKILKWIFIEQDLEYWNHSGRNRLKTNLDLLIKPKKKCVRLSH